MRYAITLALLLSAACASVPTGQPVHNPNVVTRSDLADFPSGNLYDALKVTRPSLLNGRGRHEVVVYVDGLPQVDGVNALRAISVADVASIERVSSSATLANADGQFGDGPALYIKRKR